LSDIPNRALTPEELKKFKKEKELQKLLDAVEAEHTKRSLTPAKWFGRLAAALVVALFLDITGWVAAFIDGSFYKAFALVLQSIETISIVGIAALAIHGSIEAYKLQQELGKVRENFEKQSEQG
jgi:hypothetical protein